MWTLAYDFFRWYGQMVRNALTGNTAIVRPQCQTCWFSIASQLLIPLNVIVRRILSVKKSICANFEVSLAVYLKILPFWDMTLRHWEIGRRHFEATYCPLLQGSKFRRVILHVAVYVMMAGGGMDYSSTDSYTRYQMPLYTRGNIVRYSF
jgi:hypothetical protein